MSDHGATNMDSSDEEAYAQFKRDRKRRKENVHWEKRVEAWKGDPVELLDICRYYSKLPVREREFQLYDHLEENTPNMTASDITTILQWWHKDPEKRELLNVMLQCGNEGPAEYMVTSWMDLNAAQRAAIEEHSTITADYVWEKISHKSRIITWPCLHEVIEVLNKHGLM